MRWSIVFGTLVAAALATVAGAQDSGNPQPPTIRKIMTKLAVDRSHIPPIVAAQAQEPLGPNDILKRYEQGMEFISERTYAELANIAEAARRDQISSGQAEYLSRASFEFGIMQFQLLHTLHQVLEHNIANAAAQRSSSEQTINYRRRRSSQATSS